MKWTQSKSESLKILVPVDDGSPSRYAVEVAAALAERANGRVMLLNVVQPETPRLGSYFTAQQLESARREMGAECLQQFQGMISPRVVCDTHQDTGKPSEIILLIAEQWHPDLIVMGTRGRDRLAEIYLGGTTNDVIREAKCPVVAVSHPPSGILGSALEASSEHRH